MRQLSLHDNEASADGRYIRMSQVYEADPIVEENFHLINNPQDMIVQYSNNQHSFFCKIAVTLIIILQIIIGIELGICIYNPERLGALFGSKVASSGNNAATSVATTNYMDTNKP